MGSDKQKRNTKFIHVVQNTLTLSGLSRAQQNCQA